MSSNELHCDRTIVYSCKSPVAFCPKYRWKVLVPPIDGKVKERILEKQDEYGFAVIEIEVMLDHVPHLLEVDPRIDLDAVVRKVKGYTTDTIRQEYPWMKSRLSSLWTRSGLIVSVGAVSHKVVRQYIEEQKVQ